MTSSTAPNQLTGSRYSKVREVYGRMSLWVLPDYGFERTVVEDDRERWDMGDSAALFVAIELVPSLNDPVRAIVSQNGVQVDIAYNHRGLSNILAGLGLEKNRG